MTTTRQFTRGQKFFVIMVIFVCGLLFYANAVTFGLISAPIFVNDIIAYGALIVAVTLTIITLTIVIRDKRRSLFSKTQKSNIVNSSEESVETSSMILSPVDSQENADTVDSSQPAVQTTDQSDKTPVTPSAKSSRKRNLIAILITIAAVLLLYVNFVAFNLIALPEYSMYVALAGAVALTIIIIATALIDKRRGADSKKHATKIIDAVKESNAVPETADTVSSLVITQESIEKVDSNDQVTQAIQVPDEIAVTVLSAAKRSKRRSFFAAIIAIVVGLLVYVNIVAFGLFTLPVFSMYAAAVGVACLIAVLFVLALAEKRRGAFAKIQKASVVSAATESNEALETVSSSVDLQESISVVETDGTDIQTLNVSDEAQVLALPKAKSAKKKSVFILIIAIVVGLLFFANCVAFGLISLPGYSAYALVASACALTIIIVVLAIVDKRKSALPKAPIVEVVEATKESNLAKVFGKRNVFVIIVAFTIGLLFFANTVAFGLISLPEYSIYSAVAGAVAVATIAVTVMLSEKVKVLGSKIKSFLSEPDMQEIIKEVKEPDQSPDTAPAPVIAQTSMKKVDAYAELLRRFGVQKTFSRFEADKAEQEKQLPKKPVISPTKVICPACRKEFNLPIYERNYIVDFGPSKPSNLIRRCPHCETFVTLKQKGALEENLWKE